MMKRLLSVLILSSCCFAQIHIGGHSLNLPKRNAPKGGSPEVQLQGTTAGMQGKLKDGMGNLVSTNPTSLCKTKTATVTAGD